MTLKVKVNDPHFQYQLQESQEVYLVNLAQSTTSYPADKPNFIEFWDKKAKMTLKVTVNDLHFQSQPRVSRDACLVQIWWFQLKSVTSYHAEKEKFMYRQTNRPTDGLRDRQRQSNYHFSLKGQRVKRGWFVFIIITALPLTIFDQNLVYVIGSFLHKHTCYYQKTYIY